MIEKLLNFGFFARPRGEYFLHVKRDRVEYNKICGKPLPRRTCVIYFTPRSGSSWLTETLRNTRRLGHANELYNPNFMPKLAQRVQAINLDEYIKMAPRALNRGGVFSFEVTWHQINKVFDSSDTFVSHYKEAQAVWLTRKDIVAQAVSLSKMIATGVAHSSNATPQEIKAAEEVYEYDAKLIKKWLIHIRNAEIGTEEIFRKHDITPWRLSYEDLMAQSAKDVTRSFAKKLRVKLSADAATENRHVKISGSRSQWMIDKFKDEEKEFLCDIYGARKNCLDI